MQSADPFPASEFDQWAESYDADVLTYDTFPFAGYEQVLDAVVEMNGRRGRHERPRPGCGHR